MRWQRQTKTVQPFSPVTRTVYKVDANGRLVCDWNEPIDGTRPLAKKHRNDNDSFFCVHMNCCCSSIGAGVAIDCLMAPG